MPKPLSLYLNTLKRDYLPFVKITIGNNEWGIKYGNYALKGRLLLARMRSTFFGKQET